MGETKILWEESVKRKTGFLAIICCILAVQIPGLCAGNPSPDQLIAEHLKSIGNPDALPQIKSIVFTGNATVNFLLGMTGYQNQRGVSMLISEGPKMGIRMSFPDKNNYPGEHFAYDGKDVTVANFAIGRKSPIAEFIHRYNKIMKNGLLGGVFSNAWPLLDIKSNKANMKVRKTKMDGTELYELEYRPRDYHGDMKISLYFDTETYRHIYTEYKVQTRDDVSMGLNPRPGTDMGISLTASETYYTLIEKFDNFGKVGDLTLPHSYMLNYSITHLGSMAMGGFAANWTIEAREWGFNTPEINQNFFNTEK
ncbi:MAG: hypothetical protein LBJ21_04995 [Acidobacteriota bacterium]|jgi:hypothetical protein|nr:hypothetical protein [Acidobacteriota bacterium]